MAVKMQASKLLPPYVVDVHVILLYLQFLVVSGSRCDMKRFRVVFRQPQPNKIIAGINQSAH